MEDRIRYPEIDSFIRSLISREKGIYKEMEEYARALFIPIVPPETAALLKVLTRIHRPQKILEAGTAIGYSALIMAEASDVDTRIDTIEINEQTADIAEKNIAKLGYAKKIKVIRGDALEVMQCLTSTYDMIFLDASKGQYIEYLSECLRLTAKGGVIISDNVLYKGLVAQDGIIVHKHRTIATRLKEYLGKLCNNPELETAVIPIGDGMAVSYRL